MHGKWKIQGCSVSERSEGLQENAARFAGSSGGGVEQTKCRNEWQKRRADGSGLRFDGFGRAPGDDEDAVLWQLRDERIVESDVALDRVSTMRIAAMVSKCIRTLTWTPSQDVVISDSAATVIVKRSPPFDLRRTS